MKRTFLCLAGVALVGLVGCDKGTSTAPATKPGGGVAPGVPATHSDTRGGAAPATSRSGYLGTDTTDPANRDTTRSDRKLTVTSPGSQTVTQDQTDEMKVSINRDNFAGPVKVELRNLPKGVAVVTKELTIPANESSVRVTVKADPDAPPVDSHKATVSAKAENEKDMKEAVVDFNVTVKAKR